MDLAQMAQQSNVRLTQSEIDLLRRKLLDISRAEGSTTTARSSSNSQLSSVHAFRTAGRQALEGQWAREFCLSAVEQPTTPWDKLGAQLLFALDV